MGRRDPEFLANAKKRAEQRQAFEAANADAHVRQWREKRSGDERLSVRVSVARQRRISNATGKPERMTMIARELGQRKVPDPSMTDAEFWHQVRREGERAERRGRKPDVDIGKVLADENAITRIGALTYIKRREEHHERAAERFKSLYEHLYGAGNPALDTSRVQVDTSIVAHDAGMAARIDKGRKLADAMSQLGKDASNRLIALLVLCAPAGGGLHWRSRTAAIDQVLADLDALCIIWGMPARGP